MGDEAAANFPYITLPLQDMYNAAKKVLSETSSENNTRLGIVVLGEANAGKTRLALEILIQTLPHWNVLIWNPAYTVSQIPVPAALRGSNIAIFIDDLQEYVPDENRDIDQEISVADSRATVLQAMVNAIRGAAKNVVVVATCRIEDELQVRTHLSQLLNELTIIRLTLYSKDTSNPQIANIISDFQRYGPIHAEDWDGTLGSLVLGLTKKNNVYLRIRKDFTGTVLHAMKLLTLAGTTDHTEERIRAVCAGVFDEIQLQESQKRWRKTVDQLIRLQFVTEEEYQGNNKKVLLVIRKDSYFDKVITEYPSSYRPNQLSLDLLQLQSVFVKLKDAEALLNLGGTFSDLKRYEEAVAVYEEVIQTNHSDEVYAQHAYINKSVALYKLKHYEEALIASEHAIHSDPNIALFYNIKGRILTELQRYEEALSAYEQAIHLDPRPDFYIDKGNILGELQRYEEALAAYEQAIHLNLNNASYYFIKGDILYELKRYEEALTAYEQVVHLDPNNSAAYQNIGFLLADFKRFEEALVACEQALRLDPGEAESYFIKGNILFDLQRPEEALAAYEEALRLNPNNISVYINKGILLLTDLAQYEEALATFEQALRLDPNNTDALSLKETAFAEIKHFEELLSKTEKDIRIDPYDAEAYYFKGFFLDVLNRHKEAQTAYEQAVQLDSHYDEFPYNKGIAVADLERFAKRLPSSKSL